MDDTKVKMCECCKSEMVYCTRVPAKWGNQGNAWLCDVCSQSYLATIYGHPDNFGNANRLMAASMGKMVNILLARIGEMEYKIDILLQTPTSNNP